MILGSKQNFFSGQNFTRFKINTTFLQSTYSSIIGPNDVSFGETGWVAEQQGLTVVKDEARVQVRRGVGVHSVDAFEIIFLFELLRSRIPKVISGLPF